jgi:predicted RNase H-like HicB family nuclease
MCGTSNDIPLRTLLTQDSQGWTAHCLDFDLQAQGEEAQQALDRLEEAIVGHLQAVKSSEVPLFRPVGGPLWRAYYAAAEAALNQTGPGQPHFEHRPLMAGWVLARTQG